MQSAEIGLIHDVQPSKIATSRQFFCLDRLSNIARDPSGFGVF